MTATGMHFQVVAEGYRDLRKGHGETQGSRWGPAGIAHLMVDGAPDTLCAKPVGRFLAMDDVALDSIDVDWCLFCQATART